LGRFRKERDPDRDRKGGEEYREKGEKNFDLGKKRNRSLSSGDFRLLVGKVKETGFPSKELWKKERAPAQ